MEKPKRQASAKAKFNSMEKAVESALKLFPKIEDWAFGEGAVITPSLKRKFDEVKKLLEESKNTKIKHTVKWYTEEMKKAASKRMKEWHAKQSIE